MNTIDLSFVQLLRWFFPQDLLDAFTVTSVRPITNAKTKEETLEIQLKERNTPPVIPAEHRGKRVLSKGFHRPITLQHFPVQDRYCILIIHRRRWEIEGAGTLERTLSFLPDNGLKITTDFAIFLKEADRTRTSGSRTHRETLRSEEA
jgi:hypothetical protein